MENTQNQGHDPVNRPSHYTEGKTLGLETVTIIRNELTPIEFQGWLKGNALKYLSRAGKKGSATEDIGKARTFLNWLDETYSEDLSSSEIYTNLCAGFNVPIGDDSLPKVEDGGFSFLAADQRAIDSAKWFWEALNPGETAEVIKTPGDDVSYRVRSAVHCDEGIEVGQRYKGASGHEFEIVQSAGPGMWLAAPVSNHLDVKEIPSWVVKRFWALIEKQEEPAEQPKPEIKPGQVWKSSISGHEFTISQDRCECGSGDWRRDVNGHPTAASFSERFIRKYCDLIKDAGPEEEVSEKCGRVIRKGQRWRGRYTGRIYTVAGPEREDGGIPIEHGDLDAGVMHFTASYEYLDEGEQEVNEGEATAQSIIKTLNDFIDSMGYPEGLTEEDVDRAFSDGSEDEIPTPFGFEVSVALPDGSFMTGEPEAIATTLRALWGVK